MHRTTPSARSALVADALTVLVTAVLLWPLHRRGIPLGRDMVFVPHQAMTDAALGLGSAPPRAVPLDALVAAASTVLPGAVIARLALALPLLLAGWGTRRLLDRLLPAATSNTARATGRWAVAVLAVWNPFVVERLALGQWALLWSYAALPYLALAARRLVPAAAANGPRFGRRARAWCVAIVALAAAAITPTGAVVAGVAFVALAFGSTVRQRLAVVGVALLLQLPWLLPALTAPSARTSDPAGIAAFAARGEHVGGPIGSLLGLGGIWDARATPPTRSGVLGLLGTLAVVVGLVVGGPLLYRSARSSCRRLGALALAGFLLAALGNLPGGGSVLRWAVRTLPGAGLLRDGEKWLLPFVLVAVLAAGAALARLAAVARPAAVVAVAAALFLPVAVLPDAAATLRAPLAPATYPADWSAASRIVNRERHGGVLVLPFAAYRQFRWVRAATVLDPAPRWLRPETVVDDRLVVSGRVLSGEDRRAASLRPLADASDNASSAAVAARLRAAGIGWVWVERGTPGPPLPDLRALSLRRAGAAVELYRVPGRVRPVHPSGARRVTIIGVDVIVAALVAVAGLALLVALALPAACSCYARRRRRERRTTWAGSSR